jgi:hypothetical protein
MSDDEIPVVSADGAAMLFCFIGLVRYLGREDVISPEAFADYLREGADGVPELAQKLLRNLICSFAEGAPKMLALGDQNERLRH